MVGLVKFDLENQVVELPGTRKPGQTGIYRNAQFKDGLLKYSEGKGDTLYRVVAQSAQIVPDKPYLGQRLVNPNTGKLGDYSWLSYREVVDIYTNIASGIMHLNKEMLHMSQPNQWPIGIYSVNRREWVMTEMAASSQSLYSVSLFDTYGQEVLEYVINHSEIPIVFASINLIHKLLQSASRLPTLKLIVSMDPLPKEAAEGTVAHLLHRWAANVNVTLLDFDTVAEIGRKHPVAPSPPKPEDIFTICYTSGTTGRPKGAVCTHLNFVSVVTNFEIISQRSTQQNNVYISYLPLAHCFERSSFYSVTQLQGTIGFYSGNILNLIEDLQLLKPTLMISVPRLLNRFYDRIHAQALGKGGITASLFQIALNAKIQQYRQGGSIHHSFWDSLVFSKIRNIFGGRLEILTSGSAPIAPKVLNFLRLVLSTNITEGYGCTETCAGCTSTLLEEREVGSVGPPGSANDIKLVDVPEMDYLSTDLPFPRGELCVRGHNIFREYYKDPEETAKAIDEEGWFHTGDIVYFNKKNLPVIIDRKKNLFKLSQGEYISPEKIEIVYSNHPLLMQVFTFGDSFRSKLVAIVVPDMETFPEFAKKHSTATEIQEQSKDPKVVDALLKEMHDQAKKSKLSGFEKVYSIYIELIPFSPDNGLITPTLKLKRHELKLKYLPIIEKLYKDLS